MVRCIEGMKSVKSRIDVTGSTGVFMSLNYSMLWYEIMLQRRTSVRDYIKTFLKVEDAGLLMYAVGCARVDPVGASYMLVIVDPEGGKGKSTST
jgi:hypothetical protein